MRDNLVTFQAFVSPTLRFITFGLALATSLTFLSSNADAQSWSSKYAPIPSSCSDNVPDYKFEAKSGYTTGNAFLALVAATIAENWTDSGIRKDLASFGFQNTFLIGKVLAGSYGYITEDKDVRILAFRGTHSIHEAMIDLTAASVSYADVGIAGKGHAGMKMSFKHLWDKTIVELAARQKKDPKPLVVLGHSLGGSLAMLHAVRLKKMGYPVLSIYTAAQNRIGDETLMAEVDKTIGDRYYRMENASDPVPNLPPTASNAQAFADVFATQGTDRFETITSTVERLNYTSLPGWTLQMTPEGFSGKRGRPAEIESELYFINDFRSKVEGPNESKDVAIQLSKNVLAHIGDSYVCNFLKLVNQGYQPAVPY